MKRIEIGAFGVPHEVASCVEQPDPGDPGPGEAVVEVLAFPINPADLLLIEGRYASRPKLPAPVGAEGVARIVAVGEGVSGLTPGDRVMMMGRETWTTRKRVKAGQLVPLPSDADPLQQAMLKVNPATAERMLRVVELGRGDWVIQDAANSAVGQCLIRLARARALRTVNVVRRPGLEEALHGIGADVVVVDGDDLAARVLDATGGERPKMAIDAVAGGITERMADALADGGTVVTYGLLSGEACRMRADQLIFRGQKLLGYWLQSDLASMTPDVVRALYRDLSDRIASGELGVEVEAVYPIEQIAYALEHAARPGRNGKILVSPNPS